MWISHRHRLQPIHGPDREFIHHFSCPPIEHVEHAMVAATDDETPIVGKTNLPGTGMSFGDFNLECLDAVVVIKSVKRYPLRGVIYTKKAFAGVHVCVASTAISVLNHVEE